MKSKLYKTLLTVPLFAIPYTIVDKSVEIFQKYQSLTQFDNSETSLQLYRNISNLQYVNYFLILGGVFALLNIWTTKNNQTNNENE